MIGNYTVIWSSFYIIFSQYQDQFNYLFKRGYACKDPTKLKLSEVEYNGKVRMHTLDKLVETQIIFLTEHTLFVS